jgi:hypothetical protein
MMKPAVEVVNATVPEKPEAADSVLENVPLLAVEVEPDSGAPWVIVSGVTVSV